MGPVVRTATAEDSRFLAEIMYQSMLPGVGRGVFDSALAETGVDPIDFNEALLLAGASNWGQIEDFLVLDAPGAPRAGAAAAYLSDRSDRRPLTGQGFEAVAEQLAWPRETARSFWRSYVGSFGLFGDAPQLAQPAPYVLEYISVREALRRRGFCQLLLGAHLDRARALGHRQVAVSAMFGNEPALAAYLRAGFREHARLGAEAFGGAFPGMVRLVREVPAQADALAATVSAPR